MKHTATPWTAKGIRVIAEVERGIYKRFPVAYMNIDDPERESEANAAFIAQVVNAHDALLAACKAAVQRILEVSVVNNVPGIQSQPVLIQLRAAIALAEEEGVKIKQG